MSYLKTKEEYLAFRQKWKDYVNNKVNAVRPEELILYAILRGKDPRKGFQPCITNKGHWEARGRDPWRMYREGLRELDQKGLNLLFIEKCKKENRTSYFVKRLSVLDEYFTAETVSLIMGTIEAERKRLAQ